MRLLNELRTLKAMSWGRPPNIVQCYGAYMCDTEVWTITEDSGGDSLTELYRRH
jgi:hypothetical protein